MFIIESLLSLLDLLLAAIISGCFIWFIYEVVIISWFSVDAPELVFWQYCIIGLLIGIFFGRS